MAEVVEISKRMVGDAADRSTLTTGIATMIRVTVCLIAPIAHAVGHGNPYAGNGTLETIETLTGGIGTTGDLSRGNTIRILDLQALNPALVLLTRIVVVHP